MKPLILTDQPSQYEVIDCNRGKFDNIDVVAECENLIQLLCAENNLTSIPSLEKCLKLETLDCSVNKIVDINFISTNINLIEVDFSYNEIADITPLFNLKKVKYLNLTKNPITQDEIDELKVEFPNCNIIFENL